MECFFSQWDKQPPQQAGDLRNPEESL